MTRSPTRLLLSLLLALAAATMLTACQEPASTQPSTPASDQPATADLLQLHQEMSLQASRLAHTARTVQPRSPLQPIEQMDAWRSGKQPRPQDLPLAPGETVSQVDLARRLGATDDQLELFALLARDLDLLAREVRSIRSSRSSQMLQAVHIQDRARRAEQFALRAVDELQRHAAEVAAHLHAHLTGTQPPSQTISPPPPWITGDMPSQPKPNS